MTPPEPTPEPPPLPAALLRVWPVIGTGVSGFSLATIAAFAVPGLESWRPVSLAGLGVGVIGTTIFLVQRSAARRGARGAQTGLENE
ncbi:DUF2530 domain-containing protein [Mycolicibacter sp. MYC123]|uniref:DUF2530 domain-containing protein n=2 Tax=Mycolicibacter TaxID=1073531 RepID=A0ABU5YK38_9MYCO|nr:MULTISPECIES: DUF2530 domain-containing protein [unclassified Mycolicibacter]MEB3050404.1 DUF2530 domain-containing protein [Mycolicibacter sp. MYC123]MEB3064410.1 DUF2530 domain-containing protein [Mycolicibacter sp. MYC101]MEB3070202.1 DUF2530 domain-containing protein [Mycolicibacter sp. MYC017]